MRRVQRLFRDASGVNLLEAAIITPLLLLLTFAIVDFASVFYAWLALENGVSQATRYAVTGNQMADPNNPGTQLSRIDSIKQTLRDSTPTLTIPDQAITFQHMPLSGGAWQAGAGAPNEIQKVSVDYTWNIMTPLIRPFFNGGQLPIHVESAMKNEDRFK